MNILSNLGYRYQKKLSHSSHIDNADHSMILHSSHQTCSFVAVLRNWKLRLLNLLKHFLPLTLVVYPHYHLDHGWSPFLFCHNICKYSCISFSLLYFDLVCRDWEIHCLLFDSIQLIVPSWLPIHAFHKVS